LIPFIHFSGTRADQSYNFPLLSDFNKTVSNLYETIHPEFGNMGMLGVSKRSAFIIDKSGILALCGNLG
jgi:peroxiredoxin